MAKLAARERRTPDDFRRNIDLSKSAVLHYRARLGAVTWAAQNFEEITTSPDGSQVRVVRRDSIGKQAGNAPPQHRKQREPAEQGVVDNAKMPEVNEVAAACHPSEAEDRAQDSALSAFDDLFRAMKRKLSAKKVAELGRTLAPCETGPSLQSVMPTQTLSSAESACDHQRRGRIAEDLCASAKATSASSATPSGISDNDVSRGLIANKRMAELVVSISDALLSSNGTVSDSLRADVDLLQTASNALSCDKPHVVQCMASQTHRNREEFLRALRGSCTSTSGVRPAAVPAHESAAVALPRPKLPCLRRSASLPAAASVVACPSISRLLDKSPRPPILLTAMQGRALR